MLRRGRTFAHLIRRRISVAMSITDAASTDGSDYSMSYADALLMMMVFSSTSPLISGDENYYI